MEALNIPNESEDSQEASDQHMQMDHRGRRRHKFVHYDPNVRSTPIEQLSQIRSHARKASSDQHWRLRTTSSNVVPEPLPNYRESSIQLARQGLRRHHTYAGDMAMRTGSPLWHDPRTAYVLPQASSKLLDPLTVLTQRLTDPILKKLWHEAVNQYWLNEQHVPMEGQEPLVWAFLKHCLSDNLLFHCATAALAGLHDSRNRLVKHNPHLLQQQNRAIILLRDEVAREKIWRTDEFLLALLCMTPGESIPELLADPRPHGGFTPLLTELQYLKSNGMLKWHHAHKTALVFALRQRGGISTIKLSGLAELMQNNDLVDGSHTLAKPIHPMCISYQHFLDAETVPLRYETRESSQQELGLTPSDIGSALYDMLWDMRAYINLLKLHAQGLWTKVDMPTLATHRNIIQYRFLSGDLRDDEAPLNELAHIGAHIFTFGVIYPLPDRKPHMMLSTHLRNALEQDPPLKLDDDFIAWLLIVAAIATIDLETQSWFITRLAQLYETRIKDSSASMRWDIMSKMEHFVWMDAACNEGFFHVWTEVEKEVRKERKSPEEEASD
jgi:hypothetical protein